MIRVSASVFVCMQAVHQSVVSTYNKLNKMILSDVNQMCETFGVYVRIS